MPKVTVAITTYNREEYLKEAIKSVLAQTFQDFQIIVFDNHSDYDIAWSLADFHDDRISLVRHERNIGGAPNIQFAFSYAYASDYAIIFHDDDTMHPELLAREVASLEANPEAVFAGTGLNFVHDDAQMEILAAELPASSPLSLPDKSDLVHLLLQDFDLGFGTIMYRSKYLRRSSLDYTSFFKWCDRPFLVSLAALGPVIVLKEKLINYRIHLNQDSQSGSEARIEPLFNLYKYYRDNLPQPLARKDRRLFYYFSTNQIILSGLGFSQNFKEYRDFIKTAKKEGLFKLRYLNIRGLYYFSKVLKKFL